MKVKLTGWEPGLRKISLTKLQMEYLGLSLKEAKTNTDKLLNNETVEINIKLFKDAQTFIHEAIQIGALCYICDENT